MRFALPFSSCTTLYALKRSRRLRDSAVAHAACYAKGGILIL